MSEVATRGRAADLYPCDLEVWRLHYAETLRHWYDRFEAQYRGGGARALRRALLPDVALLPQGLEVTFRHNRQCVFQLQLARQEAVPLTRDYLYPPPQARQLSAAE
jgi:cyclopropane-fatty-acyl-phospholipid synthase